MAQKKEEASGWGAVLSQTTIDRPEKKTAGVGNDLPVASKYVITTPNPNYVGFTMRLAFQNGRSETEDREVAFTLREDFGYTVVPVE